MLMVVLLLLLLLILQLMVLPALSAILQIVLMKFTLRLLQLITVAVLMVLIMLIPSTIVVVNAVDMVVVHAIGDEQRARGRVGTRRPTMAVATEHSDVIVVELVELLLLAKKLLLRLGGRLLSYRELRLIRLTPILLLLRILFLLLLLLLLLVGSLQDKLDIARVLAPFHQDLKGILVRCQQTLVVAPPFDEREAARLAGGVCQREHNILARGDFRDSAHDSLDSFDPHLQLHRAPDGRWCLGGGGGRSPPPPLGVVPSGGRISHRLSAHPPLPCRRQW